jgi:hypothetical protein
MKNSKTHICLVRNNFIFVGLFVFELLKIFIAKSPTKK